MAQNRPVIFRHNLHQIRFDFIRIGMFRQTQEPGDPFDMGINRNTGHTECIAQYDIRGFSADTIEGHQILQVTGHITVVPVNQRLTAFSDVHRLVAEKPGGMYSMFQFFLGSIQIILGRPVFCEQRPGDLVYPFIGTLRGQDGRDQQVQRVREVKGAFRILKRLFQAVQYLCDARTPGFD